MSPPKMDPRIQAEAHEILVTLTLCKEIALSGGISTQGYITGLAAYFSKAAPMFLNINTQQGLTWIIRKLMKDWNLSVEDIKGDVPEDILNSVLKAGDVMTLKELAKMAIDIQNASNLSGVLHEWAHAQQTIRQDPRWGLASEGPHERHPINIMFMSKVASLMIVATDCIGGVQGVLPGYNQNTGDLFTHAYEWCKKEAL